MVDINPSRFFEILAEFPLFELPLVLRFAFVELLAKKYAILGPPRGETYEAINPCCSIMFFLTFSRLWSLVI